MKVGLLPVVACVASSAVTRVTSSAVTRVTINTGGPLGVVDTVCDLEAEPPLMYIEVDETLYKAPQIPPGQGFETSVPVPEECVPYEHVYVAYNPRGHPTFDGKGGGYGVAHYDVHFFMLSQADREDRCVRLSRS